MVVVHPHRGLATAIAHMIRPHQDTAGSLQLLMRRRGRKTAAVATRVVRLVCSTRGLRYWRLARTQVTVVAAYRAGTGGGRLGHTTVQECRARLQHTPTRNTIVVSRRWQIRRRAPVKSIAPCVFVSFARRRRWLPFASDTCYNTPAANARYPRHLFKRLAPRHSVVCCIPAAHGASVSGATATRARVGTTTRVHGHQTS